MSLSRQIFQSDSGIRWKTTKLIVLSSSILFLLAFVLVIISLFLNSYPQLPKLIGLNEEFQKLKTIDKPVTFKSFGTKKKIHKTASFDRIIKNTALHSEVRAAFLVNWDSTSINSLKKNIASLNLVCPEWLFLDPDADTIVAQIDWNAYHFIKDNNVKMIPMLSNFFNDKWNHECVVRIAESPKKRKAFISNIIEVLNRYGFDGINIDFEDLYSLKNNEDLVSFHKQLYDSLQHHDLITAQCIPAFNEDYKINDLHKFNDYIFVMAYDEHYMTSEAGPISSAKWVEQVLDYFNEKISSEKLVLCFAGYGYDWIQGGNARTITFSEAMSTAKETGAQIEFDNTSYNVHFSYYDDQNKLHTVWFADAATNFNIMRTQAEYNLAGAALWRLGSEDPRLWSFYSNNLNKDSLNLNPVEIKSLSSIVGEYEVNYIGDRDAQILDVLSEPKDGKINIEYDKKDNLITEEKYVDLPSSFIVKKTGNARKKEIVLTFDDGPDPEYTEKIMHILKAENVPGAFFMIGQNMKNNISVVKKIYDEGYEIGNHTYSHPNLTGSSDVRYKFELNSTRRILEVITNHSTILFRPPFNSDILSNNVDDIQSIAFSRKENFITVGESIDPQDWRAGTTADSIYDRVLSNENKSGILLLHDGGGDREATVEALPRIIQHFKEEGYTFGTISGLLGRQKTELMPAITNPNQVLINELNYGVVYSLSMFEHFIYYFFIVAIILAVLRIVFVALLAYIQRKKSKAELKNLYQPKINVIIPAFNESVNIVKTINNHLKSNYPDFEIIFVNDGSTDNTLKCVTENFSDNKKVIIINKSNGGKASALNIGIQNATADFVVCVDADTHLMPDTLSRLMEGFTNENIGAIAGTVNVGNRVNWLSKMQSIEYITSQNFDRRAFDLLNCITVIPGAIGAFRKSAIVETGGYLGDTLAEDCDLTVRLLRKGYTIRNNSEAVAYTEVPENLKGFLNQRFRWTYGVFQSFWKNRDTLFRLSFKSLGMIAMPNILIFQIILPVLAPLIDFLMIISLFTGDAAQIGIYYMLFQLFDVATSALAFSFGKEKMNQLWWLVPQRFTYRWLMYYILFKTLTKALKGEIQNWNKIIRTGNVEVKYV